MTRRCGLRGAAGELRPCLAGASAAASTWLIEILVTGDSGRAMGRDGSVGGSSCGAGVRLRWSAVHVR